MDNQGEYNPIIRETAEAALREMEFYRESKRRRLAMSLWRPKAELTPQQEIAYQQSTCDPLLRQVAKIVLEEVQYNRNERNMGWKLLMYAMVFIIFSLVTIPTIIFFAVGKGHSKYKSKH